MVVTGHVLRELKQVSAGGECLSRPWRARAKSDLQLGKPENLAALAPPCQGPQALSGVLRRLQQVEEKILQVKASLSALSLCLGNFLSAPTSCLLPVSQPAMHEDQTSLCHYLAFSFLPLTAEEGSELGQQGISQKEH